MPLTLRPAGAGDVAAVLELWRRSGAQPTHTDDADFLVRLIAHDPEALILALAGPRIVGTVIAGWDGWRGSVYRLVVAPEERRRGLGGQLLAAAESRLARCGAVRSHAIVVGGDAQAAGFWGSTGWRHEPERLRYVKG